MNTIEQIDLDLEDYSSYSSKDLEQLREILKQTIQHYAMKLKLEIPEGAKLANELCKRHTEEDLKNVELTLKQRASNSGASAQTASVVSEKK
jgi:hypothetical protein